MPSDAAGPVAETMTPTLMSAWASVANADATSPMIRDLTFMFFLLMDCAAILPLSCVPSNCNALVLLVDELGVF
jgi:hypothetical protein